VLYLTAVKETQEKLQLCQRYGKHHELCGKAADLPIAACSPSSPDIILKHALHSKIVHYENPTFFSINLKSAIQDLLNVL